jgi:hypothetical protein
MLRKKLNLLFLAFAMLQSCDIFSKKEPEELIKLENAVIGNKNPKKSAHYVLRYAYFDFINGTVPENFNTNINEVLWKRQLRQSCDKEIFIEEEHISLDIQKFQELLSMKHSNIFKHIENETISNIKLINDYDSLREYEVYTTKNSQQFKRIHSFIRIDNKWLNLIKPSYGFADDFENLAELSTKELPIEFMDKLVLYVQDHYRLYFLGGKVSGIFPIYSNELISILKKSHIPKDTKIIITAPSKIPIIILDYIFDMLREHEYDSLNAIINDTLDFSQDSLYKYNMAIKTRFERDVNIDIANLNRNICTIQPVAFAIDSLNKVYLLPKFVDRKLIDYEFIKHYLIQSIKANYDSLQLRKNWAYCLDLIICPAGAENAIREQNSQND